jgi:hypothetical protein
MPACPTCGHMNAPNTLVCAKCSTVLPRPERDVDKTIEVSATIFTPKQYPPRQTAPISGTSIALYIEDAQEPFVLEVVRQAILGRYEANSRSQPRIDLTPYRAYDKGVSRLHAIIRRTENGLMIEDLASTNGTWLNDTPLDPYMPRSVNSGDRIRLSKLELEIRFDEKAH